MTKYQLYLLGTVKVIYKIGNPPRFRSQRTIALLGYLVAENRQLSRDALAGTFWPDEPLAVGRANLRRELHNLSSMLPNCWQVDRETVQFIPGADTQVDLDMLRHNATSEQWLHATEWVGGDFLEGLSLADNPEFEIWLESEREGWRQQSAHVLMQAALIKKRAGDYQHAQLYLEHLLKLIPWHEEGHRQMMRLCAHRGLFSASLKQYERCREILASELAVAPSFATTALCERIKTAMAMPAHNLPPQPTPFIGREDEVVTLIRRLADPDCRLLTLSGIGGIGKSRLALEVARHIAAEDFRLFLHGVVYVPLVGVDRQDLTTAVSDSLGLALSGSAPAEEQLLHYLRNVELLLILDNYEHVLPDTVLLATILRETPEVKLLVTSRERLRLQEEWLFEVDGLMYPDDEALDIAGTGMAEYSALRLFSASAQRIQPNISLETYRREVVAICRLVQGMPLALELSAARLNSLTPGDVLAELERGPDILASETRNIPSRHTSLHAVFDASWNSLSAQEQRVLCQLSLFRGGFTRDAADKVAEATLPVLNTLIDKCLIRQMPSTRYEMHELLRQYVAEKVSAEGDMAATVQERYAAHFGVFLRDREQRLLETHQEETLGELEHEMDNIRAAWRWLIRHERIGTLIEAVWTLASYYQLRGRAAEGLVMVEEVLAHAPLFEGENAQHQLLRARLHLFQGVFLYWSRQLSASQQALICALPPLRVDGSGQDVAAVLFMLGQTLWELGESGASVYLEEGFVIAHRTGVRWLEGFIAARLVDILSFGVDSEVVLHAHRVQHARFIGQQMDNPFVLCNTMLVAGHLAAHEGNHQQEKWAYEQALMSAQRINHLWLMGLIFLQLGHVNFYQGDFVQAKQCYLESDTCFHRTGTRHLELNILNYLGESAHYTGETQQALRYYQECLALNQELGNRQKAIGIADEKLAGITIVGIAETLVAIEQYELATRLMGAATMLFATLPMGPATSGPFRAVSLQNWGRILAVIKEQLGEEAFAVIWEAGRSLSLNEAIDLALKYK